VYALGFLLGPRLNAAGRIGNALLAFRLLTTRERGEASQIAQQLEVLNRERQAIEIAVVDQAMMQAEAAMGKEGRASVLVVTRKGLHPGVVGLAAARLKERFQLPSFVLAEDGERAAGSGSRRDPRARARRACRRRGALPACVRERRALGGRSLR
ncbi:MAG: hypothetical protein HOP12_11110, partial [Candidatus Eisenbacteria bacterium]|nr:hypothetical protein [Candidatus Eisenbacteria bacterium]